MTHYFIELTDDDVQIFPCGVCYKTIAKNHKYMKCSICNFRVHIKCNKTDLKTYQNKKEDEPIFCIKCQEEIIPFQKLSDHQFFATSQKGINNEVDDLDLTIFPINRLKTFFRDINNLNVNIRDDNDEDISEINCISCNYVDIDSFKYKTSPSKFSLFHLNIASLAKHKEELEIILNMLDLKFDILGITESKLKCNMEPLDNINMNGYKFFSTPSEVEK